MKLFVNAHGDKFRSIWFTFCYVCVYTFMEIDISDQFHKIILDKVYIYRGNKRFKVARTKGLR